MTEQVCATRRLQPTGAPFFAAFLTTFLATFFGAFLATFLANFLAAFFGAAFGFAPNIMGETLELTTERDTADWLTGATNASHLHRSQVAWWEWCCTRAMSLRA